MLNTESDIYPYSRPILKLVTCFPISKYLFGKRFRNSGTHCVQWCIQIYKYKKCFKCNKIYTGNLQVQVKGISSRTFTKYTANKTTCQCDDESLQFFQALFKRPLHELSKSRWAMWTWSLERVGKRLIQSPPSKTNNLMSFSPVLNKFQAACKPLSISLCSSLWNSSILKSSAALQESIKCSISSEALLLHKPSVWLPAHDDVLLLRCNVLDLALNFKLTPWKSSLSNR